MRSPYRHGMRRPRPPHVVAAAWIATGPLGHPHAGGVGWGAAIVEARRPARGSGARGLEDEVPAGRERERAAGFDGDDLQAGLVGQAERVADLARPPFGMDRLGRRHAAACEVLKPAVAVEARTVLAE